MTHAHDSPIIIRSGSWNHIHMIQAYHRHFPEIRGEGGSRDEAIVHLTNQLVRAQDSIPCHGDSEAFEQAIVDVQSMRNGNSRRQVDVIPKYQNNHQLAYACRE